MSKCVVRVIWKKTTGIIKSKKKTNFWHKTYHFGGGIYEGIVLLLQKYIDCASEAV